MSKHVIGKVDGVDLICPFCQGTVKARIEGDKPEDHYILHTTPTCAQFDKLEPDEFLRAVRIRLSD